MKPKRIQRKRTKGWRMPKGAVYVGRPSKWGNPYFAASRSGLDRRTAVMRFRAWITHSVTKINVRHIREELRGKDLICWCPLDQPCHADVLLEIANS